MKFGDTIVLNDDIVNNRSTIKWTLLTNIDMCANWDIVQIHSAEKNRQESWYASDIKKHFCIYSPLPPRKLGNFNEELELIKSRLKNV